jgi:hypothetical protein
MISLALVVLLLCFQPWAYSFSIQIHEIARASTRLRVDRAIDAGESSDFWGRIHSEEEIVDYVSDAVFGNIREDLRDKYNEQRRWVEVISAEPPVRRSDFSYFHALISSLSPIRETHVSAAGRARILGAFALR